MDKILEAMRSERDEAFIVPTVTEIQARKVILFKRIVDNYLNSYRDVITMKDTAAVIHEAFKNFSMDLKSKFNTIEQFQDDWTEEMLTEVLIGYSWDRRQDTLHPHINLNKGKKIAGKSIEEGLATNPVLPGQVTQRITLRILMELWDPLGKTTSGYLMGLKVLFAKVCKVMTDSEIDIPIASKNEELATEVSMFINSLVDIDLVLNIYFFYYYLFLLLDLNLYLQ